MNITADIRPLRKLKENSDAILSRLKETGEPIILTRKGEPAAVIQDPEAYQELLDLRERLETILAVRSGLEDLAAGKTLPIEEAFSQLEAKHGL